MGWGLFDGSGQASAGPEGFWSSAGLCSATTSGRKAATPPVLAPAHQGRALCLLCALQGSALKDEVMKIMPVQKQTRAGQRTRFKVRLRQRGFASEIVHRLLVFFVFPLRPGPEATRLGAAARGLRKKAAA